MVRKFYLLVLLLTLLLLPGLVAGCGSTRPAASGPSPDLAAAGPSPRENPTPGTSPSPAIPLPGKKLVMATTTSTVDTGLLDGLNPVFEKREQCVIEVIALGTGAALAAGREGNVDLVLVHAPEAETEFVKAGYGVDRRPVMFNDFVILGPSGDPAGIMSIQDAAAALKKIAKAGAAGKAEFVSRGDNSGTHMKENSLWKAASITPTGAWYLKSGQGMGDTLSMAAERNAYVLSDRATYLKWKEKPDFALGIMVEGPTMKGDDRLINNYSVIAVNPKKYPDRNYPLAVKYIAFLTSLEGQKMIGEFTIGGQVVFRPICADAGGEGCSGDPKNCPLCGEQPGGKAAAPAPVKTQ